MPLVRVDALHLVRGVPLSLVPRPSASSLGDAHIVGWTSGSTGKPKAMAVTNWRIAHWSRWRTFHMPASSFGTRAAMNLFWIWYWHIPLAMGRTLVITPSEHNIDVLSLLAYIEAKGATYIDCLTPSQMQLIAELADTLPPSLIHICSSGEALPLATAYVPPRRRSSSAMPFTLPPSHLGRAPGAIHPVLRSHLTQPLESSRSGSACAHPTPPLPRSHSLNLLMRQAFLPAQVSARPRAQYPRND